MLCTRCLAFLPCRLLSRAAAVAMLDSRQSRTASRQLPAAGVWRGVLGLQCSEPNLVKLANRLLGHDSPCVLLQPWLPSMLPEPHLRIQLDLYSCAVILPSLGAGFARPFPERGRGAHVCSVGLHVLHFAAPLVP
mmetsp:Transcript_10052/g.17516  ORF Transcript_10052/g.17516 Transcript_10052/m.17516 type:complete len:135 (-) Transcript_10052:646-1050(-)